MNEGGHGVTLYVVDREGVGFRREEGERERAQKALQFQYLWNLIVEMVAGIVKGLPQ